MPQLNPEFFLSQVFWLVITFCFLLFFLWRVSLPRISSILEKRENKINDDIKTAKKIQTEAEVVQNKIDNQLKNTHEQMARLIKETTNKIENNISAEINNIDKELTKKIIESEKFIEKNKSETLENIKLEIKEITKLTISKLTSIKVTDKEIDDALESMQNKKII